MYTVELLVPLTASLHVYIVSGDAWNVATVEKVAPHTASTVPSTVSQTGTFAIAIGEVVNTPTGVIQVEDPTTRHLIR